MLYALAEDGTSTRCRAKPEEAGRAAAAPRQASRGQVLVIGQYLGQLHTIAELIKAPLITGKTTIRERQKLFDQFRAAEIRSWSSRRSATSPSTCRTPTSPSRCRARSARAGRGAAAGAHPAAEAQRPAGPLLHPDRQRHARPGLRRQAPDVPDRAGLPLRHPVRPRSGGLVPATIATTPIRRGPRRCRRAPPVRRLRPNFDPVWT